MVDMLVFEKAVHLGSVLAADSADWQNMFTRELGTSRRSPEPYEFGTLPNRTSNSSAVAGPRSLTPSGPIRARSLRTHKSDPIVSFAPLPQDSARLGQSGIGTSSTQMPQPQQQQQQSADTIFDRMMAAGTSDIVPMDGIEHGMSTPHTS